MEKINGGTLQSFIRKKRSEYYKKEVKKPISEAVDDSSSSYSDNS